MSAQREQNESTNALGFRPLRPLLFLSMAVVIFGPIAVSQITGIWSGEDSWRHFAQGGTFAGGAPSLHGGRNELFFSSPGTGQGDIYRLHLATRRATRVTASPECDTSPLIDTKAGRLYFTRESGGVRHLISMDMQSGEEVFITTGRVLDDPIELSPDGRHLLYSSSPLSGGLGRITTAYLLNLEARDAAPVRIGSYARFSPSGSEIIYNLDDSFDEIGIRRLDDHEGRIIGTGRLPQISADLNIVIAVREPPSGVRQNNRDIIAIDRLQGTDRIIAQGHSAALLADGSGVLYFEGYGDLLHYVSIDGRERRSIDLPSGSKTAPRLYGDDCVIATNPMGPMRHFRQQPHLAFIISLSDWTTSTVRLDAAPAH